MHRIVSTLTLLAALLAPSLTAAQVAVDASRAEPIAELLDLNRDGRYDRVGDTVVVAGRASVAAGSLYPGFLSIWVEDASGGILLYQRANPAPVAVGDSVVARGVVTQYLGLSELLVIDYRVVPGARREPASVSIATTPAALASRDGRLATIEGELVGWGSDVGGVYAILRGDDHRTHVALYVSMGIVAQVELTQYGPGDRLRVTGIVVPFRIPDERSTMSRATYRIVPRGPHEVGLVGMSFVLRRAVTLAMPLVLLGALVAVVVLRLEVRRQTRRIQESEQRYRSLYEYNPYNVAEYDLAGRVRAANAALRSELGAHFDGHVGQPISSSVPEDERPRLEAHLAAAARGESRRFEIPLRRPDGGYGIVDLTLLPIVVNGEVSGIYSIGMDVTERMRAQRELEATAELLSSIVETQQAIARAELDAQVVTARVIELVPRITSAELADIGIVDGDELVMPRVLVDGAPLRLAIDRSVSGEAIRSNRTVRCDDALEDPRVDPQARRAIGFRSLLSVPLSYGGTTIGVLTVSSSMPHAFSDTDERSLELLAGQLAAALSHAREFEAKQALVAERTMALEALQASELRFRSIIEHSTDLVSIIDEHGVRRWSSPASRRMLGHEAAQMLGRSAFDQIHHEDLPQVRATLAEVLAHPGRTGLVEARHQHADGSWRVLESVGHNMLENPAVRGIVVNSRDITEQRRLEDQLRHAQKMEAVGQLAGGIAHDFNNILTVIRVHSAFLLEAMADRDPRRVDAEEIQRAGDRAAALTKQLLAFSRRQILQPRAIDLNAAIRGIEPMLRRLIGEDITFMTQLDTHVGAVSADAGQLEQVLLNLVVNARDAMPQGGTLTIHTGDIIVRDALGAGLPLAPGHYSMLAVSDSGIGIDEATLGRVFEPFFTTKEQGKGTGLGLATVYGVVQQSGGTITVESEPAVGTTFRVYLPSIPAEDEGDASPQAAATPPRGCETILVVEDEDAVRTLARRILGARGYRIIEARNGRDALEQTRATDGEIDLVLTDVVMPEMGGRELAETLLMERPDTRVLFMSGYTDDDILRRGLHTPGVAFLHKPFTVHDLTESVRRALDDARVESV